MLPTTPSGRTPHGRRLSRRTLLRTAGAGAAWLASAPFARTAHARETLSVLLEYHWVPGANDAIREVIAEGCAQLGMAGQVDFFSTMARQAQDQIDHEEQEQRGHDLVSLAHLVTYRHREALEPVDDVMEELMRRHGPPDRSATYICHLEGVWRAVPTTLLNSTYPQVTRIDHWKRYAGVDLPAVFPPHARRDAAAVQAWTWEAYLAAARKLHAGGYPVGNPIGTTSDANDWLGPLFFSFGSVPVDADGNVTIDSDGTRHALEFMRRLAEVMPPEVFEWDDASNNRFLISGRGSAIINPPSAWALARRRKPAVAAQLWHHDVPAGPAGRFRGSLPRGLGIWRFARHKDAAKQLLRYLWEPKVVSRLLAAAQGYDVPPFPRFNDDPVWRDAAPPAGVLYNYPVRGDEQIMQAGYPAPAAKSLRVYAQFALPHLVTRVVRGGESFDTAIAWARSLLE